MPSVYLDNGTGSPTSILLHPPSTTFQQRTYESLGQNAKMGEAVAGLALAASILQVLDYGRQFVSTAWKLYESGEDKVESLASLQSLSKNLDSTLRSANCDSSTTSPEIDEEISVLATESRAASVKIQGMLNRADLTQHARRTKRKVLRAAFVSLWNRDEIKSLEVELDGINKRLNLALLESLR